MYKLEVNRFFEGAHQLTNSPQLVTKACARYHGHTYLVCVELQANKLNEAGMVIDFTAIKKIIDLLDHQYINQVLWDHGDKVEPTAENIAKFIHDKIMYEFKPLIVKLRVSVCEGYKGPENSSWVTYEL